MNQKNTSLNKQHINNNNNKIYDKISMQQKHKIEYYCKFLLYYSISISCCSYQIVGNFLP